MRESPDFRWVPEFCRVAILKRSTTTVAPRAKIFYPLDGEGTVVHLNHGYFFSRENDADSTNVLLPPSKG